MNHKRGFTLIELAIVIVIAGILAAVAIPIYQSFVDDAKWSEAETAMGSIKTAADVYLAKYGAAKLNNVDVAAGSADAAWAILGGFDTDSFKDQAYWGSTTFSFATTATTYTIIVDTAAGTAINPPSDAGSITLIVDSTGAAWTKFGSAQ